MDGQQSLLVVVGSDVELEHVGSSTGAGEDASVAVEAASRIAVSSLEGQVLLAATVVSLGPVGVEVDSQRFSAESSQECILIHHLCSQVINLSLPFVVQTVNSVDQVVVAVLPVANLLVEPRVKCSVLGPPGGSLVIRTFVESGNISNATVVLALSEVLQVGDGSLPSVILTLCKLVQSSNLSLPGPFSESSFPPSLAMS